MELMGALEACGVALLACVLGFVRADGSPEKALWTYARQSLRVKAEQEEQRVRQRLGRLQQTHTERPAQHGNGEGLELEEAQEEETPAGLLLLHEHAAALDTVL